MSRKNVHTKRRSEKLSFLSPQLAALSVAAMGIVFGDIGTSPLYAVKECLRGLPVNTDSILGILSLIFWVLMISVSIKYLLIILRADNHGEGGVLALLALLRKNHPKRYITFLGLAMLGAGLLFGDGMLTPAISVLSAVEGIEMISPSFAKWIVPCTVVILIVLFWQQHRGTHKIGICFGPIMIIWFILIAMLGIMGIAKNPSVLHALNPYWALHFFVVNKKLGFIALGGIFLVITGGEALYADLGHFGRRPIQWAWFVCAMPSLVLNYFGQGALLLNDPSALENPFYALTPTGFLIPMVILATLATIIASQAVISAVFSLAKQAISLELIPKARIIQTSEEQQGQIYVPSMNVLLALGTILLVLMFQHSSSLASAYGIAVNLVMLIVTLLVALVARSLWQWSTPVTIIVFGIFIVIDTVFLSSNLIKIEHGGWLPLAIGIAAIIIMKTWYRGMRLLRETINKDAPPFQDIIKHFKHSTHIQFIPKLTAIFIVDRQDRGGNSVLHYLKLSHTLPEQVFLVSIVTKTSPYVTDDKRCDFSELAPGFYNLVLNYGFMEIVNIPQAISEINKRAKLPIIIDEHHLTFFTERKNITVTNRSRKKFRFWQKQLFSVMQQNSLPSLNFYHLPINRTISIGGYYEI